VERFDSVLVLIVPLADTDQNISKVLPSSSVDVSGSVTPALEPEPVKN
jgi:hypothetical protein